MAVEQAALSVDDFRGMKGWTPNDATRMILERVRPEDIFTDIDFEAAYERYGSPELPDYLAAPIHGVPGGFASPEQPAGFDAVVHQLFEEYGGGEENARGALPALVTVTPERILDVACGTGTSTTPWHDRFPDAEIVAVDLSPYMLAVAERRLAGLPNVTLEWGTAEALRYEDASFDVVTTTFLLHELPKDVAPRVLSEMRRVLRPGGQLAVLEPYPKGSRILHPIPFPEPFLKDYLSTDWDEALAEAGFADVGTLVADGGWIRMATPAA